MEDNRNIKNAGINNRELSMEELEQVSGGFRKKIEPRNGDSNTVRTPLPIQADTSTII